LGQGYKSRLFWGISFECPVSQDEGHMMASFDCEEPNNAEKLMYDLN